MVPLKSGECLAAPGAQPGSYSRPAVCLAGRRSAALTHRCRPSLPRTRPNHAEIRAVSSMRPEHDPAPSIPCPADYPLPTQHRI